MVGKYAGQLCQKLQRLVENFCDVVQERLQTSMQMSKGSTPVHRALCHCAGLCSEN